MNSEKEAEKTSDHITTEKKRMKINHSKLRIKTDQASTDGLIILMSERPNKNLKFVLALHTDSKGYPCTGINLRGRQNVWSRCWL